MGNILAPIADLRKPKVLHVERAHWCSNMQDQHAQTAQSLYVLQLTGAMTRGVWGGKEDFDQGEYASIR